MRCRNQSSRCSQTSISVIPGPGPHRQAMRRIVGPLAVSAVVAGGGVALAAHGTVTRARADAVAAAINLLHPPSYATVDDVRHPITPDLIGAQLGKCLGSATKNGELAQAASPALTVPASRYVMYASTTAILQSQGQIASDMTAVSDQQAVGCLTGKLGTTIRASFTDTLCGGSAAALFSLAGFKIASLVRGSDGTFAYRFRFITGCKHGFTFPTYADYVGFAWGQAEITLTVETNNQPPPVTLERQLVALLLSNARRVIN